MLMNDGWIRDNRNDLFDSFDEARLQPASYDLVLGNELIGVDGGVIVYGDGDRTTARTERLSTPLLLEPGRFVLGSTKDVLHVPDGFGARFEGKSSLGRMGLATHVTAGFIDPGFCGELTVEIKNMTTSTEIELREGMPIGQICFYSLNETARSPYGGRNHYDGQTGPTLPFFMR